MNKCIECAPYKGDSPVHEACSLPKVGTTCIDVATSYWDHRSYSPAGMLKSEVLCRCYQQGLHVQGRHMDNLWDCYRNIIVALLNIYTVIYCARQWCYRIDTE
jgi:hypothetical protein